MVIYIFMPWKHQGISMFTMVAKIDHTMSNLIEKYEMGSWHPLPLPFATDFIVHPASTFLDGP